MIRIQLTPRWQWAALLTLVAACVSGDGRAPTGPDFAISDAANSGGTPGFYFLPPMVPQPVTSGVFDNDIATIDPAVVICDVTDGPDVDCGGATPALRAFTTISTPAIVLDGEKYKVDWNTREGNFAAGRTYRVRVLGGVGPNRRQLGFADVLLTTEPGKVRNLTNGETIVLNDGRTLPIHFRLEQGVIVAPGDARSFELAGLPASLGAGTLASVTVTARDENGNVATGYRGTITFTSSDPEAALPTDYTFTEADAGMHTFGDALSFETSASVMVRLADAGDAELFGEHTLTVQPAAAASLEITGLVTPRVAGAPGSATVTARDAFGNVATGYTGTVGFTSSDPLAALPEGYTFTAADAGSHVFADAFTFRTAGEQTLTAADGVITAIAAVIVDPASAATLRFTTQPSEALEDSPIAPPVVVTAYDPFDNVATEFTGQVTIAIGTNPAGGMLSGAQQRSAVLGVATFDDLGIDRPGTGYTLVATAGEVTGATSDPFEITADAPTEVRWLSPVNGLWSDGTKWSTGSPPTADQVVYIDVAGTYTVTMNVDATVNQLRLGAPSGVQSLTLGSGRTLTLSTSGAILSTGRMTLTGAIVSGTGILSNAGMLSLSQTSTINTPLVNAGTLAAGVPPFVSVSTINGTFTTVAGSLVRIQGGGSNTATLAVASGFTNHGTIELTKAGDTFGGSILTVNGTLINAPDGIIRTVPGTGGGRTLTAQLDNRGTVTLDHPLTINRGSADHMSSGIVQVNGGNLTLTQTGTTPSFTNTGTITVAAGRSWVISGGSFTHASGATLDGGGAMSLTNVNPAAFGTAFTLGALTLNGTIASIAADISTETMTLSLTSSTLNGPGTLTNAAGRTLSLSQTSTINTALVNAGTLAAGVPPFFSTTTINGPLTTVVGSLMRVHAGGSNAATLTVASGFTNHGTIELTKAGDAIGGSVLTVNSGTLINAPGGTIRTVPGTGGGRSLAAELDNQGTVTLGHPLTINRASAQHTSSGTITVTGGDLTVTQSGTSPSFSNAGLIDVATTRAMRFTGGTVTNQSGGSIQGAGTFESGTTTAFNNAGSVTATLVRVGAGLSSAGTFAPVTAEFFGSATSIPVGTNYVYTNVRVLSAASFAGSIEIPGNLTVAGSGNLTIGAHEVFVEGDFATQSTAVLTMQNAAGRLNIRGNASFGGGSTNTRLTAGTLVIGGNLTQPGGSAAAFAASTNHVTELDGPANQTVFFANPGAATTASHFQGLVIANFDDVIALNSAVFANGRLTTLPGQTTDIASAGHTLTVGGLNADGLVLDNTPLRVVNGQAITRFDNALFRNMDPTVTQFRLDRLADVVTFNNVTFETTPTTGVYLHLVDTDLGGTLFTVTMHGTTPANHGGKVIESMAGQLFGWPF